MKKVNVIYTDWQVESNDNNFYCLCSVDMIDDTHCVAKATIGIDCSDSVESIITEPVYGDKVRGALEALDHLCDLVSEKYYEEDEEIYFSYRQFYFDTEIELLGLKDEDAEY